MGFVRVKTSFLESFLVPIHDGRGALERNAPGFAAGLTVHHESRIERAEPFLTFFFGDEVIKWLDQVLIDQGKHVGGEQHRKLRGVAAAGSRHGFGQGVGIGAGIDRIDIHVFMGRDIVFGQRLDGISCLAANRNREIELQVNSKCWHGNSGKHGCCKSGFEKTGSHGYGPFHPV